MSVRRIRLAKHVASVGLGVVGSGNCGEGLTPRWKTVKNVREERFVGACEKEKYINLAL